MSVQPAVTREVLIAEDSPSQAESLHRVLLRGGYKALIAKNGIEALRMARQYKPTIVISDIVMPEMDGYSLCREIKNDAGLRNIPVILLSVLSEPEDIIRGLDAGADNYVTKPYQADYLLSRISSLLATPMESEQEGKEQALPVTLTGKTYFVTSGRRQILNLLVSTFENAVEKNRELHDVNQELIVARATLEDKNRKLKDYAAQLERDVARRQQAEQQMEVLHAELETQNRELERRNGELQDFAYVVSHDLRAPLVNIQGFSGVLEETCDRVRAITDTRRDQPSLVAELVPLISEEIPDSLTYIRTSASKMNALLTGLLKISQCGSAALSIEQLDMNETLSDIVDSMKFLFEQADASIEVEALPSCRGDKTQVSQVFANLLDNARKFLDPNRPGIIRISGWQEESRAVFCVEDNGMGIDPKSHESIFKLFHRIDPDQQEGLGLGLTLVRRLVERQGGKIWLESVPHQGSKFYVSLLGN